MTVRLDKIKNRLKNTTVNGSWIVIKPNEPVLVPSLSDVEPYFKSAEDYSIVNENRIEVLGCSEWLRCNKSNLEFMAHAKSDIEYLLNYIERKLNGEF